MSASLVGSEMCIRDRPTQQTPSSSARSSCPPVASAVWLHAAESVLVVPCLLYTSDAADDM
eukprot:10007891-Alexandrium_andersonii.AAC.1